MGNPTGTVMQRALLTMLLCWPLGYLVGRIAQRTVQVEIDRYKKAHPIASDPSAAGDSVSETSTSNQESDLSTDRSA